MSDASNHSATSAASSNRRIRRRLESSLSNQINFSNQIGDHQTGLSQNTSKKFASLSKPNKFQTSFNSLEAELKCPICLQLMEDPYATICAHAFCHKCLRTSLEFRSKCPKCGFALEDRPGHVFPNFTLSSLTKKCREISNQMKQLNVEVPSTSKSLAHPAEDFVNFFNDPNLDLSTVSHLIDVLDQKRVQLEQDDKTMRHRLLKDFLDEMLTRRRQNLSKLSFEMKILETDMKLTDSRLTLLPSTETSVVPSPTTSAATSFDADASMCDQKPSSLILPLHGSSSMSTMSFHNSDGGPSLISRRRSLRTHFDDLEQQYLANRVPSPFETQESSSNGLNRFVESLSKMTQFSTFKLLGTLNYNVDMYSGLSIVSSIEFDRDGELFTIAGVTKKIKLYEYNTVLQDTVDIHYPVCEMQCGSKISCVSWNPYNKGLLASSDYEGIVQLWDVYSAASVKKFQEHEKRCWSVCFNAKDPNLMASGSDDAKVKLWSVNCKNSVGTIEAKVNVCCVHFNPESREHLAFGSADHCVHYYDLRNPKQPQTIFRGHKKAVSYVKFINSKEVVSASTDSQLRMWSIDSGQCVRIFKGHQNEKNFVGLDTDSDFIACGSENNFLYIYYKELSKPLMTYPFRVESSLLDRDRVDPDSNDFVSAVCWKKQCCSGCKQSRHNKCFEAYLKTFLLQLSDS